MLEIAEGLEQVVEVEVVESVMKMVVLLVESVVRVDEIETVRAADEKRRSVPQCCRCQTVTKILTLYFHRKFMSVTRHTPTLLTQGC